MLSIVSYGQLLVDSLGNMGLKAGDSIVKSTFAINSAGQSDYDVYILSNKKNGVYINNKNNNYTGTSYGLGVFNSANHRTNTDAYGVHSQVRNPAGTTTGYMYGVYGQASTGLQNYGVFGLYSSSNDESGAAICGSVNSLRPIVNGQYAGFFNGDVFVEGSLYRSGGCYTTVPEPANIVNSVSLADDAISTASTNGTGASGVLSKISQISALRYDVLPQTDDSITVVDVSKISQSDSTQTVYSLDVATLQAQFPSLVKISDEGTIGIDYTGLIPILLQSIQELQAKVAALEADNAGGAVAYASSKPIGTTGVTSENIDATIVASIAQNTPNPFSEETRISYTIPQSVSEAMICIYDMNGTQIERIDITERGSSSVVIEAGKLNAGMYLYSLIVDGNIVDTKRMVLTK